jgi:hypothetical protein
MLKEIYWLENKRLIKILKCAGVLVIPVVLYFVPLDWLNNQHSICLYKNFTGHECLGCGMTRALISAVQLQFRSAYHFNKLFLIVLPILVYLWAKTLLALWYGNAYPFPILWEKLKEKQESRNEKLVTNN